MLRKKVSVWSTASRLSVPLIKQIASVAWEREDQAGWIETNLYVFMFRDIVTNCGHNKVRFKSC